MKVLVIGASLSGKTSIVSYFRSKTNIPVLEIDEELVRLNNGTYPADGDYKLKVLVPKIINETLNKSSVLFFTNTDYFTLNDLKKAKAKGFKIVQLELDLEGLNRRNEIRVKNEEYEDLSKWLKGMVDYQKQIQEAGVVDKTIEANKPIHVIVEEIMKLL